MKTYFGLWVLTIAFTISAIGQHVRGITYDAALVLSISQLVFIFVFVFWHGIKRYGLKSIVIFFFVVQIVGNIMENLCIVTGFPSGHYHYTHTGMPFLFQVPILAGIAYFAYGYLAWTIANILLDNIGGKISSWLTTFVVPITASFVMVMWDVVMDPINSTVGHNWIWENGGGFNGVPLTNFLGWFLTTYLFYQIFAIYLRRRTDSVQAQESKSFWIMPVLMYLVTGAVYILMYVSVQHGFVADATGRFWDVKGIYETATIVFLFTMAFSSFLALIRLFQPKR